MASWGLGWGLGWGGDGAMLCTQGGGAAGTSSSCRIWSLSTAMATWGVAALCWDVRDWNCHKSDSSCLAARAMVVVRPTAGATSTSATSLLMARCSHLRSWFPLSSTRSNPLCCTLLIWSDWSVIWLTASRAVREGVRPVRTNKSPDSDGAQIICPIRPADSRISCHMINYLIRQSVHTAVNSLHKDYKADQRRPPGG
jgi:hypothetical protein